MKKVLFVATVSTHIKAFHIPYLKWFKENGFEVRVACNAATGYEQPGEKVKDPEIPYCDFWHDIPFARSPFSSTNLSAYKMLKAIIDENNFSIVHSHTPVGGVLARLAAKKARKSGTKSIYTAHGFHFFKGASKANWLVFYPIEKFLSKSTDCLITINDEDYNTAVSHNFKAKEIIKVNGVGVNLDTFSNNNIDVIVKRAEFGISPDDFVLLSVGELNNNKNHRVVIEAVSKLNNPKVKYLICGSGALKEELLEYASSLNITNQIIFGGYRTDTKDIYPIANIFVFPSFREGLPVSLMEAMAAGLPTVVSKIRGNKDLTSENQGGFLIDNPADAGSFAEKINLLIESEELRHSFSEYNKTAVKQFSLEVVMQQMIDIYKRYI